MYNFSKTVKDDTIKLVCLFPLWSLMEGGTRIVISK